MVLKWNLNIIYELKTLLMHQNFQVKWTEVSRGWVLRWSGAREALVQVTILSSDWTILIPWPEYWPLVGHSPSFSHLSFVTFQVIIDHFSKKEELGQTLIELKSEKHTVETENKQLRERSSYGSISSSRPMRGENPGQVTSLGQSEAAGSRKRKTPSPQPPPSFWKKEEDISALGLTPKVGPREREKFWKWLCGTTTRPSDFSRGIIT